MPSVSPPTPSTPSYEWQDALREFLLHQQVHLAANTVRFYQMQLTLLSRWAEENGVPLDGFTKRHMDRYLAERSKIVSRTTLHHDGVATKVFLKWCSRNDILDRNPLIDFDVKAAPKTAKAMPAAENVGRLLQASRDFWSEPKNPAMKYHTMERRILHRDRNYAILLLLVDTACRIGEALSLLVTDYLPKEREIRIRESKGKEPRAIPLSGETVEAIDVWLKTRARLLRNATEDEGWLFLSELGGPVDPARFGKAMANLCEFAEIAKIRPHDIRHFALNKLAKHNLLAAQQIAGHKNPQTTLIYTRIDADFVRQQHAQSSPLLGVLAPRREHRKRLL